MKQSLHLLILATFFAFTACNSEENRKQPTGDTVTITHALDTVQVPVNPQRVVVLDFGALENVELVDANVVGIPKTGLPNYLSKYENDTSVVDLGNLVEVSMEKINELQPDLIIIGGRLSDTYEDMSQIAPTIMPSSIVNGQIKALEKNLNDLGKIFDHQAVFDSALTDIKEKAKKIRTKAKQSEAEALVVLHNRGRFSAYGSGSRFGLVHDALGIEEAKKGLETDIHGARVSNEFIQQTNPDILYIVDRSAAIGDQPLNKEEIENQLIQQTNAYKNDKIIYLDPAAWYLSGGAGVESLNIMLNEVAQTFKTGDK
ncbi:MAG TPA: ABC transporter substrate-binding protein [Fodinibius sp.]|nr:ABC transporter substrate-binding protein [Fodinibius sp.]